MKQGQTHVAMCVCVGGGGARGSNMALTVPFELGTILLTHAIDAEFNHMSIACMSRTTLFTDTILDCNTHDVRSGGLATNSLNFIMPE